MTSTGTPAGRARRPSLRAAVAMAAGVLVTLPIGLWAADHEPPGYPAMAAHCDERITVVGGTDASLNAQRQNLIRAWNDGDLGGPDHVDARLVEVSPSADQQRSQLWATLNARDCVPDVAILDSPLTAEFAGAGLLTKLADIPSWPQALRQGFDGDFLPDTVAAGEYRGERYAVPFNLDVGLMYHLKGTTPPATQEQMLGQGYIAQFADYEGLTVNILESVWNNGARHALTAGRATSRAVLADDVFPALERLATSMSKDDASGGQQSFQETESMEEFASGRRDGKVLRHWINAYRFLASDLRMRQGPGNGELRFQVAPRPGATVLGGQNLAVPARSRRPAAALKLIDYLTRTESQRRLFSCGGFAPTRYSAFGLQPVPPAKAVVQERNVAACSQLPPLDPNAEPSGESDNVTTAQLTELANATMKALANAERRPTSEHYSTFSAVLRTCLLGLLPRMEQPGAPRRPTKDSFAKAIEDSLDGRITPC
ncbi:extracellular solute-binding protein [Actinomadura hibisca]|uniref:extracellular solute-binding protein n=1 Tax=Actinomadura hibisca TaxID=68565 RepID=UPI00082EAE79|nr:extracellular solute-binding protein [Actinomadura hibisca]